jgi:hypothetical protein
MVRFEIAPLADEGVAGVEDAPPGTKTAALAAESADNEGFLSTR